MFKNAFVQNKTSLSAIARILSLLIIGILTVSVSARSGFPLSLQDAPLSIPKSSSITRKLVGIPFGIEGTIWFEIKWHVNTFLPTYNSLKIELLHGSTVLKTDQCYSVHSDKTPKCSYSFVFNQAESLKSLDWKLRVTNNSLHDVNGFNVKKEITDLNPLVRDYSITVFTPICRGRDDDLRLSGYAAFDIAANSAVEQVMQILYGQPGVLNIKAKWHTEGFMNVREAITPTYLDLKLSLFDEAGALVKETTCFSYHSPKTPKCSFSANVPPGGSDRRQWKLRIENRHSTKITGFDIRKGSDLNPLVPGFVSTFKPNCS